MTENIKKGHIAFPRAGQVGIYRLGRPSTQAKHKGTEFAGSKSHSCEIAHEEEQQSESESDGSSPEMEIF